MKSGSTAYAAVASTLLSFALVAPCYSQFSSGSTGADGAFTPANSQEVQVPASGVFNFTTVTIPTGVQITFKANAKNTPVVILATGDVRIDGNIDVSGKAALPNGSGGDPGPGGFRGGNGGFPIVGNLSGGNGEGPGGGVGGTNDGTTFGGGGGAGYRNDGSGCVDSQQGSCPQAHGAGGKKYGSTNLIPLLGGSGGGGGAANISGTTNTLGGGGSGGGGALLIASSTQILFTNAQIRADSPFAGCAGAGSGSGSGGAIRLIANTISGNPFLTAQSGQGWGACVGGTLFNSGKGSEGLISAEAYELRNFSPPNGLNDIRLGLPNPVAPTNFPELQITSVGGVGVPPSPLGSFTGVPDIQFNTVQSGPVAVALSGKNIPVGTLVKVQVTPASGASTNVNSAPLAGTKAASTASANVTLPVGVSVVSATTTVDLTTAKANPVFLEGEPVDQIEVAAVYGGASQLTYVTRSGRRIKLPGK